MKRRQFVQSLTTFSALGAFGGMAHAAAKPAGKAAMQTLRTPLDPGKWSPATFKRLQAVINELGANSPNYNPKKRPYAVFDWDNTSIMNDTEEALFMYQINHLKFALTPEEFGKAIRQDVPDGNFKADFKNAEGKLVSLEAVSNDLVADYTFLWHNFAGMKGSKPLEDIVKTEQFIDFRAKLYFLYEAINDTYGPNVGYPWVVFLFGGLTIKQVMTMAEESNDLALGDSIRKAKYTSSAGMPRQAGVVSISHTHGLRLTPEIANTMNVLRDNGFDVYVSTASLEDVVRVFATLPKYGYNVATENVIGLRLEMTGDVHQARYRQGWPLNWGPGKTQLILREIVSKVGHGPALVFGDSDGDYDMLRDFPDTKLSIIVNRLKKGPIGELSKLAAAQLSQPDARYALQGRDERTGQWIPEETTLKLGTTGKKLLP